jgi:TRAP-type C4-dicarboxylate transport system substrate-binding protein
LRRVIPNETKTDFRNEKEENMNLNHTLFGKVSRALAVSALTAASLIAATTTVAADEIVGRLSIHWGPKHPAAIKTQEFADRVNERASGKLKIEVYPAGQLFGIREVMGALASGAVEMGGTVGVVSFPPLDKNYNVTAIPGYFESFEHQRAFFTETETGREIWNNILTKAGVVVIASNPVGPAATFSTRERLDTVESLEGTLARVLTKADRVRWGALNVGKMVSMPTREVYTGLQNGLIDTVTTTPGGIKSYSWWETLNSAQLPYQIFADAYLMANAKWYNSLPPELRAILDEVGSEITKEATDDIMSASNAVIEEFKARGGKVFELSGAELEKMQALEREKMDDGYAKLLDPGVFDALKTYSSK